MWVTTGHSYICGSHPDCSVGQWVKWVNRCDPLSTLMQICSSKNMHACLDACCLQGFKSPLGWDFFCIQVIVKVVTPCFNGRILLTGPNGIVYKEPLLTTRSHWCLSVVECRGIGVGSKSRLGGGWNIVLLIYIPQIVYTSIWLCYYTLKYAHRLIFKTILLHY